MAKKKPIIVFLSTYPPRECGIATFTQDLVHYSQKILGKEIECKIAAFNLPLDTYKYPPEVAWKIDQNNKKDYIALAKIVNNDKNISGVIIQHEYGIFGGIEGENILLFMQNCKKSMLVTLHTALPLPSPKMKDVTTKIINFADSLVVLTQNSKKIIEQVYPDSRGKIYVIPHGIHPVAFSYQKTAKNMLGLNNHIIVSTFGLLSRGKGIEYVLHALPHITKKYPSILYLILGETHPIIRRNEGEEYRLYLTKLILKLGLKKHVKFYDQYLTLPDLLEFLQATDIYISTSVDPNQSVSGTLSYALGAGRAVISTAFAQAKEIITSDIGRLVPIKDSSALAASLLELLSDEEKLKHMDRSAYEKTRPMLWGTVAKKYIDLLLQTQIPPINLAHLYAMTDATGLFQFANLASPNKDFGYTLDDTARALTVCSWLLRDRNDNKIHALLQIYFQFIEKCQRKDGSFSNYIGFENKLPTQQNEKEDLEETHARAMWALGEIMSNTVLSASMRKSAKNMFVLALKKGSQLKHVRARALAIKACSLALHVFPQQKIHLVSIMQTYADSLIVLLKKNSFKSWVWFEKELNYNNALLPESLLIAGAALKNPIYTQKGIRSLYFLVEKTFSADMYIPIGQAHWYKNKEVRSQYDQQPEDPASMISALSFAYNTIHNQEYKNLAKKCFSWFLGNNSLHVSLYDEKTGGCYDGLHPDRVNLNEGAESLLSYLMSNYIVSQLQ